MSGVLVGLAKDWNINKTIDLANLVGSFAVREVGASSGIKPFEEIIKEMS